MSASHPASRQSPAFERYLSGAIQLTRADMATGSRLQAFVRGVPLGEAVTVSEGDSHVLVPVERFPHVDFPAELRIARDDGTDAVPPVIVQDAATVNILVGEGTLTDVEVDFRNGLVTGTARNRTNGTNVPVLIGRVNGTLLRPVDVRLEGGDETGGARLRFTLPVEAGDFSDRGVSFEILHAPSMDCVWRSVLAPADTLMAGGIVTDIRLSEAERKLADAGLALETRLTAKVARQQALIEDITAHLLALVNDKGADNRVQARQLMAASGHDVAADSTVGVVGPLSPYMGWGWSAPELGDDRIEHRRMGAAATVLNPHPDRAVRAIALTVLRATPESLMALSARTDGVEAQIEPPAVGGAPCTLTIRPNDSASIALLTLSCTAPQGGIAVQDIRFFYA